MKTGKIAILAFVLLAAVISVSAQTVEPPYLDDGPGPGPNGPRSFSVAEPAAIALLGAGLVSLGFYAKRKRAKKQ